MADETTLDNDLEALKTELLGTGSPEPGSGEGAKPEPGKQAAPAASPEQPKKEGEEQIEEDPLEAKLKEIEEPKVEEKKEEKPALSDEQQQILRLIPDAQTATNLTSLVESYSNFTKAFESEKFEDVESMFKAWNEPVYEGFLEHIYKQYVANGAWVDRFIAEQEGRGKSHKDVESLRRQVERLETQLQQKPASTQPDSTQQQATAFQKYSDHVTALFEKIDFAKADRRYVLADLNQRIAGDADLMKAVRSGDLSKVNAAFKTAIREYVSRDKQVNDEKNAKLAEQEKKKAPLGGGTVAQGGDQLPDDVRAVPKGQEENWLDQQLDKLKRSFKK